MGATDDECRQIALWLRAGRAALAGGEDGPAVVVDLDGEGTEPPTPPPPLSGPQRDAYADCLVVEPTLFAGGAVTALAVFLELAGGFSVEEVGDGVEGAGMK